MGQLKFLKTDSDFAAFRKSKLFETPLLKIRIHFPKDQNNPRFGFIVPKKVVPKVVDRNLLKRRIKAVLQKAAVKLRPVDVVFYPQKALIKKSFSELSEEVESLISKAKLWK